MSLTFREHAYLDTSLLLLIQQLAREPNPT
jgi:hypothetical protein